MPNETPDPFEVPNPVYVRHPNAHGGAVDTRDMNLVRYHSPDLSAGH